MFFRKQKSDTTKIVKKKSMTVTQIQYNAYYNITGDKQYIIYRLNLEQLCDTSTIHASLEHLCFQF